MPLFIQEGGNIYVGDDAPNASKHKNLMSVKLPTLEEKSQDFHPGGSIGEIAVGNLGLAKLEVTFKLAGWDPQVMSEFGIGQRRNSPYTIYGAIRNKQTHALIEVKSVVWGRLGRIEGDEFSRGDLMGHDHMIHEILRYACYFDRVEKYYYDWDTDDWRVDGVSQNADERRILRIPGV